MQRTCITCQSRLRGRSDQRFCSDYCRNRYHNLQKRKEHSFFRKVNQILRRNRTILHQLASNYRIRVSAQELQAFGFHFDYCTSWQVTAEQQVIFVCYDMAYQRSEEEVLIYHFGRTSPLSSES
ncbi:MAG TPA: hypothetical protein VJ953_21470 [Saprospiraceae bacterium]|nr:hypothetical protein [Saprospiraceae bacterium]